MSIQGLKLGKKGLVNKTLSSASNSIYDYYSFRGINNGAGNINIVSNGAGFGAFKVEFNKEFACSLIVEGMANMNINQAGTPEMKTAINFNAVDVKDITQSNPANGCTGTVIQRVSGFVSKSAGSNTTLKSFLGITSVLFCSGSEILGYSSSRLTRVSGIVRLKKDDSVVITESGLGSFKSVITKI